MSEQVTDKEWNYDRILSAKHQMDAVTTDMVVLLQRGTVSKNMRSRMVEMLRNAADELEQMKEEIR